MSFLSVILHLCVIYTCVNRISGADEELRVRPGDNITLYCELKAENEWAIGWRRNCSHVHQPPMIFESKWTPARFRLKRNISSQSVDLMIANVTERDLGFYFCHEANSKQEGKVKKLLLEEPLPSPQSSETPPPDHGQCWMLLVSLCPICASLWMILSTCVCCLTRKKECKNKKFRGPLNEKKDSTTTLVIYSSVD